MDWKKTWKSLKPEVILIGLALDKLAEETPHPQTHELNTILQWDPLTIGRYYETAKSHVSFKPNGTFDWDSVKVEEPPTDKEMLEMLKKKIPRPKTKNEKAKAKECPATKKIFYAFSEAYRECFHSQYLWPLVIPRNNAMINSFISYCGNDVEFAESLIWWMCENWAKIKPHLLYDFKLPTINFLSSRNYIDRVLTMYREGIPTNATLRLGAEESSLEGWN